MNRLHDVKIQTPQIGTGGVGKALKPRLGINPLIHQIAQHGTANAGVCIGAEQSRAVGDGVFAVIDVVGFGVIQTEFRGLRCPMAAMKTVGARGCRALKNSSLIMVQTALKKRLDG